MYMLYLFSLHLAYILHFIYLDIYVNQTKPRLYFSRSLIIKLALRILVKLFLRHNQVKCISIIATVKNELYLQKAFY